MTPFTLKWKKLEHNCVKLFANTLISFSHKFEKLIFCIFLESLIKRIKLLNETEDRTWRHTTETCLQIDSDPQ